MNSDDIDDIDEIDDMFDDMFDEQDDVCSEHDYNDIDYEKHLKEVTEYIKEEHPSIFADMILKGIIK